MRKLILLLGVFALSLMTRTYAQLQSISDPSPSIVFSSIITPPTCGANTGSITASGGTSYLWSTGSTTSTISGLSAGNYSVHVTNALNCSHDSTILLNGPSYPIITSQPQSLTVCSGQSFSISVVATGNNLTYLWKRNGYIITGATNDSIIVTSASSSNGGNYTCIVTSGMCSVTSSTATVLVSNSPTANAGADQYINYGSSVTIGSTSVSGNSYLWSTGALTSSITVTPSFTTTYTLIATNQYACTDTDDVKVTVIGSPLTVSASASPSTMCNGGQTQLSTTALGGNGNYSYSWFPSTGLNSIYVANPTATVSTTTLYTVMVTDGSQSTTANVLVNIAASPTANAGVDQTITLGDTALLTASVALSYQWSTGQIARNIIVFPVVTRTYTLTVTNAAGCTATDSVTVFVIGGPLLFANAMNPITSSKGSTIYVGASTKLTTLVSGGTPPYTYSWTPSTGLSSTNVANPIASPTTTTTYTVQISDATSATLTSSFTITVLQQIPPTASLSNNSQSICLGDTATINVVLTGKAPWTFTYANGQGTTSSVTTSDSTYTLKTVPTIANSYVYTITSVSDSNYSASGTFVSGYAQVIANALPTANAGSDAQLCLGKTANLAASGGSSYSWSTGATTASTSVNPTTTTTYTVTATDNNSCKATDNVTITVNTLPVANAGADQSICSGNTTTLTGTGATTYSWVGSGFTSSSQNPTVSPTTTTGYTLTVTDNNGCSASDNMLLNVTARPTLSVSSQTICAGQSATLTATPSTSGGTYLWSTGANSSSINLTQAGSYAVNYNLGACTVPGSGVLTVNALPIVNLGQDKALCSGLSTSLSDLSGGVYTSYVWSAGSTSPSLSVSPATTSTYQLQVTNANGCSNADSITVTVNPLPSVSVTSNKYTICVGETVTLMASGANTYGWSTGETTSQVAKNPTNTTTYTVTGYNSFGCSAQSSAQIIVNQLPSANAGADASVCETLPTTLTASGGTSYLWNTGSTSSSPTIVPTTTTTYTVTVTDINGCKNTDNVTITVRPVPTVSLGSDITTCQGKTIAFNPSISNGSVYQWSPATGLDNPNISNPTLVAQSNMTYTLTVKSAYNCVASDVINAIVNPLPQLSSASTKYAQCEADTFQFGVTLNNAGTVGSCTYAWSPTSEMIAGNGTLTPTILPRTSSVYTLTVVSSALCSATLSIQVDVTKLPKANFSYGGNQSSFSFTNESTDAASYSWSFGDSTTSVEPSPTHNFTKIGTYSITLKARNACDSNIKTIKVVVSTIGFQEIAEEIRNISAYPNPVKDMITLTGTQNVETIQLFDVVGKLVHSVKNTKNERIVFDLSQFDSGVYYIHFTSTNGNTHAKKLTKL